MTRGGTHEGTTVKKLTTQSILNRQAFLAGAATFRQAEINLEGLGAVHVRELSAADTRQLARREKEVGLADPGYLASVAVLALCDDEGRRLLTDADTETLATTVPFRVLAQIAEKAAELTGFKAGAKDPGKNVGAA